MSSITNTGGNIGGSKGGTRGYFDTPMINKLNDNEFNFIKMITKKQAKHLLQKMQKDNRMFSLQFIKKDGTKRVMLARFNVSKGLTGKGAKYNAEDYNLMTVFDINKSAYRSVPLDRLLWLRTKGKRYYVSG